MGDTGGVSATRLDGLDGLRTIAVAAVVAFHCGIVGASGGFLGVSLFFTLSGFLVTRVMLGEIERRGSVDLRAFWLRRIRRLVPASLVVLAVVVVVAGIAGWTSGGFGGDIASAATGVLNWRLALTDRAYGAMFGDVSPIVHYWSLAVEQQFYVVIAMVIAATARWPRRGVANVLGLGIAISTTILAVRGPTSAAAYYGTDSRAAELLVGALAAVLTTPRGKAHASGLPRVATSLLPISVATLAAMWATAEVRSTWLYRGGLLGHAIATALLVLAVAEGGPVARWLSIAPLKRLGTWSYGIYLIHFPALLVLRRWATDRPVPLFLLTLATSTALAALSFRFVEEPIRVGRRLPPALLARAGFAALLAVCGGGYGAAALVPSDSSNRTLADAPTRPALVRQRAGSADAEAAVGTSGPDGAARPATPAPPTSLLLTGDSMAWAISLGADAEGPSGAVSISAVPATGCGVGRPERRIYLGIRMVPQACDSWRNALRDALRELHPSVVVMVVGLADLSDARPPGFSTFSHVGRPDFDAWLTGEMSDLADLVERDGTHLAWATVPPMDPEYQPGATGRGPFAEAQPERVQALNAVIRRFVAARPTVRLLDLGAWVKDLSGGPFNEETRPDGVHLVGRGASGALDWMLDRLRGFA